MISPNSSLDIKRIIFNREEICQSCEVGILVKNCRDCLFNVLGGYEPHRVDE